MAGRSFTAAELIERIRSIGCYENLDGDYSGDAPSAPSSGTLLRLIDVAHAHAWELWSDADEGWNLTRTTISVSSTASFYDLPDDCHKLRSVQYQVGTAGGWETLERANASDDASTAFGYGYPYSYREFPTQLEVLPAGSSGVPLRLSYCPVASRITDPTDVIPGTDGFDQVVTYLTLVMTREREEKDTSEFRSRAGEVEANFRQSIRRRDRSAPVRMRPRDDVRRPYRRRDM